VESFRDVAPSWEAKADELLDQAGSMGKLAFRHPVAVDTLGVVLGVVFTEYWRPNLWLIGLVFVITSVWATVI